MAKLLLENGEILEGKSVGYKGVALGEICFTTQMAGYQEILTDPSYAEQVIVLTYPEIGNCGVNKDDFESSKIHPTALITKSFCERESHYLSSIKLDEYLKQKKVVALTDVDTRRLTSIIRDNGVMKCLVTSEDEISDEQKSQLANFTPDKDIIKKVTRKSVEVIKSTSKNKKIKLAVLDCGMKNSTVETLKQQGCTLSIFPATTKPEEILKNKFDALLISDGPGNPEDAVDVITTVKSLIGKIPMYGVCMGCQILALALGAKTYKLKHGHRGSNHPIINLQTQKVIISTQNHGFAIDIESLPKGAIVTYKNLNDSTLEGFLMPNLGIEAVQFHPENEVQVLENWLECVKKVRKDKKFFGLMKKIGGKNAKK